MSILTHALDSSARWLEERRSDGQDMIVTASTKLVEEARELSEDPRSLEEMADVLICLRGVMIHNHWTWLDVARAVREKNLINLGRKWIQNSDGTWGKQAGER